MRPYPSSNPDKFDRVITPPSKTHPHKHEFSIDISDGQSTDAMTFLHDTLVLILEIRRCGDTASLAYAKAVPRSRHSELLAAPSLGRS